VAVQTGQGALRQNVVRRINNQYTPSYEKIISDFWVDNDEKEQSYEEAG